jgi:carboxyl-terminal processing protease
MAPLYQIVAALTLIAMVPRRTLPRIKIDQGLPTQTADRNAGGTVMSRTLQLRDWSRLAARVGVVILSLGAVPCGALQPVSSATAAAANTRGGSLLQVVLDDIATYFLEPVSTRRVALAGLARLEGIDGRLAVRDTIGGGLALIYDNRTIAAYPAPAEGDTVGWAATIEAVLTAGRQVSPQLAALPPANVMQAVLDGMTRSLDRFSRYAPPDLARDQRAARNGWGGIGITVDGANDLFRVTAVEPHSPADRAGIRTEDQIVAIDGVTTRGCVHREVIDRLRGPIGSPISLQIVPSGSGRPRELRLERARVFEPTVTAMRDGGIAIIQVHSFNHRTTARVAETLAELRGQAGGRLTGIVLDLRSNPGGVLDESVKLSDLFLRQGAVVSVVGRHPESRQYYAASGNSPMPDVPLVVLINGGSASAAEIVAAALQDAGRAIVIGSTSYGKGSVQTVLRLPDNGELILTWARLLAPSGYTLHRHGVIPTICTADLPDDTAALATALTRATATARSRTALDEQGWAALRASCPTNRNRPGLDLLLARHLLTDARWYEAALRALPAAGRSGVQTAAAASQSRR